ncbi:MAG: ABC transporter substrate-binding protein [Betaproteobacteria bacterium]|nr:MAG: ABC transporter substrate-binding protein [Betaproteobacteria bacterium]
MTVLRRAFLVTHRVLSGTAILFGTAVLCGTVILSGIAGCDKTALNNPYPAHERGENIMYSFFSERPKHLDPVQSYFSNEIRFTAQIYMTPLQYHYLKRPYQLVPFGAASMPHVTYYDNEDRELSAQAPSSEVAYSRYEITVRPGVYYQPHPAFAVDEHGKPRYIDLPKTQLKRKRSLADFEHTGTRELVAADYVYEIKRLAHPALHSPIFGLMKGYIIGLDEYARELAAFAEDVPKDVYLDLDRFDIRGVRVVDRYRYVIDIHGKYPQFLYWLAMPFFAPVPHEAERFYRQPGMPANISLDWFPVGTGPYMLSVNDPHRMMVLERNPNFTGEAYPSAGEANDGQAGLLEDAGESMPFIDKVVYNLEKESIPYWNKFLQGYYDLSAISSDSFDQTVAVSANGEVGLTDEISERDINLHTSVAATTIYLGFNMLDPVIGGLDERSRKLRQAVSIAVDMEELISIFRNGRGIAAQSPLPPGIYGYRGGEAGINPYVYDWVEGRPKRKPIEYAKQLLDEAGYPNGIDAATGKPLTLFLDTTLVGPEAKSRADWFTKQLRKIDVQLVVRATDLNRYQEKLRNGTAQLYILGWNADYPDPENFMFLLHGPQSRAQASGENASNYASPEFDSLFEQMRNMQNSPRRQEIIDRMVKVVQRDAPWAFGFHPADYNLAHGWVHNIKPNTMANNELKYQRIDPKLRERRRDQWNAPVFGPLVIVALLAIGGLAPAVIAWRRRERSRVSETSVRAST